MSKAEHKNEEVPNTKERILLEAIKVFSRYGYHGTTTRMIAKEAGINISALHYHWGDKLELYTAAVIQVNKNIAKTHKIIGSTIHGCSPEEKIDHSVKIMSDLLFSQPECASLSVFDSFLDTRSEQSDTIRESTLRNYRTIIKEFYGTTDVSKQAMLELIAAIQMMHQLVMAQSYFMQILGAEKDEYISLVNETMKRVYRLTLPTEKTSEA